MSDAGNILRRIQWAHGKITELEILRKMLVDVFENGYIDAQKFNDNMFEADLLLEALYKRLQELESNLQPDTQCGALAEHCPK